LTIDTIATNYTTKSDDFTGMVYLENYRNWGVKSYVWRRWWWSKNFIRKNQSLI